MVDIDLEKFFDKVNQDRLMSKLAERINDRTLLQLIRRFLTSGVMEGGIVSPNLEGWLNRRLRMIRWKEWKLPRTKVKKLIELGVPEGKAYEWGNTRKAYWRISKSPILHKTLGKAYWLSLGLKSISARYDLQRST